MVDRFRILVSCPRAWSSLDDFEELFAKEGIEVNVPEVVHQQLTERELLPIIHAYDGILAGDDELSRAVIEAGYRLKVISKWGVGVDSIDLQAAKDRGIIVTNTPGMFGDELADYALGFILMIARQQHMVDREVRSGGWPSVRGHSIAGRTLGLVGLGSSGSSLARRATALKMEVIGTDPAVVADLEGVRWVEMDELVSVADIVSLHLPAQPDGHPVIDADVIARCRPGFWLVNTARGSLVDEVALMDGLDSGRVGAAALDVFQREPIAPNHPLLGHPKVVVGSHNGSNTHEAVARTTRAAVQNLVRGLVGTSGR